MAGHQRPDLVPVFVGRDAPLSGHEVDPTEGEDEPGLADDPSEGRPGGLGEVVAAGRRLVEGPGHGHLVGPAGGLADRSGKPGSVAIRRGTRRDRASGAAVVAKWRALMPPPSHRVA